MLYFMLVPWDWIKQRPHFLAEGLSSRYAVTVVHNKPYTKSRLVNNARPPGLQFKEPCLLPFAYFSKVNSILATTQLGKLLDSAEIVWLTHPFQFAQIGKALTSRHKVVYDCMDDMLGFGFVKSNKQLHDTLFTYEQQLIQRSDLVISSSHHLQQELTHRYGLRKEPHVVNNAIFLGDLPVSGAPEDRAPATAPPNGKVVSYIGTIAEWFDFDLLLASLQRNERISYHLYGPCRIPIHQHERLKYFGPIEHHRIYTVMQQADALVMPFMAQDLVLSIDPVKLYEYAFSHKPAVAVRYDETLKFGEFVHLYDSAEEYFRLMKQLTDNTLQPKRSEADCQSFAQENTWERRAAQITDILARSL